MAVVTTVAGTDRSAYVESITRERGINVNGIATVIFFDPTGAWRPGEREALIITVDSVDVFVGTIVQISMGFWASQQGAGMAATVQAADGNFLLQRIMYNGIIPAGTLKAALQALPLSSAGMVLDPTQADGPALTEQTFPWTRVDGVLGSLSTITGYIYSVDTTTSRLSKVLKMWLVGSVASGITFNSANGNIDIQRAVGWSSDSMKFVNYQIIIYGPTGNVEKVDPFVADGATMSWPLTYVNFVTHPGYVTVNSANLPLTDSVSATLWALDPDDDTLYAPTGAGFPANGTTISISYTAEFPQDTYSEDAVDRAANGDWVGEKLELPEITNIVEAQARADAVRRRFRVIPKSVTIPSLSTEVVPGQTATVTISPLGLSGTYLAIASRLSYQRGRLPEYETDLISGDERPQHWVEWWQQMGGGSGGGSSVVGGGGLTPVSTGPVWLDLGGSVDIKGVTGATSGTAVDAVPILGAPYDGRTVTPYATCRVRVAGESVTPIIKDQDNNVISTGSACTSLTRESQTMPSFEMVAGRVYTLRWTLVAATQTGYCAGYLYAS